MDIKVDEISKILRQQIEGYDRGTDLAEVGTILSVGDGIGRIYGLEKVMSGELLELPHGVMGMALNLEEDSVGAVLLGEGSLIKEGDQVRRTRKIMQVPVGDGFVGRVVDPLGKTAGRQGPDHRRHPHVHRAHRARGGGAYAGEGAAADRDQGHRRHDPRSGAASAS